MAGSGPTNQPFVNQADFCVQVHNNSSRKAERSWAPVIPKPVPLVHGNLECCLDWRRVYLWLTLFFSPQPQVYSFFQFFFLLSRSSWVRLRWRITGWDIKFYWTVRLGFNMVGEDNIADRGEAESNEHSKRSPKDFYMEFFKSISTTRNSRGHRKITNHTGICTLCDTEKLIVSQNSYSNFYTHVVNQHHDIFEVRITSS